jgi:hypothetical protein
LMMSPMASSSAVSPQMEHKRGFWFGMLSTAWWKRHPEANMGKYGGKKQMNDFYPASGANAKGNNDTPRDNVGLE